MQSRQTIIFMAGILLLGINIGLMLGGRGKGETVNFLPTASAGSPIISAKSGTIFTCSEDGTKLYEWKEQSLGKNTVDPWVPTMHSR